MTVVLDASVVAKWYIEEEYSEKAAELKDMYVRGELDLIVPALSVYEVCNAIHKNPQLTDRAARDACNSVALLLRPIMGTPTPEDAASALEIARKLETTHYDAIYIQLARRHRSPLITADAEQLAKASKVVKTTHLKDV